MYKKYGLDENTCDFVGHALALYTNDDHKLVFNFNTGWPVVYDRVFPVPFKVTYLLYVNVLCTLMCTGQVTYYKGYNTAKFIWSGCTFIFIVSWREGGLTLQAWGLGVIAWG